MYPSPSSSQAALWFVLLQAGTLALISIAIILWITLGRLSDVLLTLIPLVLAGIVTLEICVLIGLKLNSQTSSRCRCCSASASRSRSTTSWRMARRADQPAAIEPDASSGLNGRRRPRSAASGTRAIPAHRVGKLMALSLVTTSGGAVPAGARRTAAEINHEGS